MLVHPEKLVLKLALDCAIKPTLKLTPGNPRPPALPATSLVADDWLSISMAHLA
jgi:hypothetical protein